MNHSILNRITNTGIVWTAIISIPLNAIIFFALRDSEFFEPRLVSPILSIIVLIVALARNWIPLKVKAWTYVVLIFLAGCFSLLLGLIDMASLWFILAIIYTIIISRGREALFVFGVFMLMVLSVGGLMMLKTSCIPLDYQFQNCQFACVAVRILHFFLAGLLIHYILKTFITALRAEMEEKIVARQRLIDAIVETEEQERKRIASDLHDGLGPTISAMNLHFQAYVDAGETQKLQIQEKLQGIMKDAMSAVSRISHNISPHVLERHGLVAALEHFLAPLQKSNQVGIEFQHAGLDRFDTKRELALYRCITELIQNTLKHSQASTISIALYHAGGQIHLQYFDNGVGFNMSSLSNGTGMGIVNIQNRVKTLSGDILWESSPGQGARVQIHCPEQGPL